MLWLFWFYLILWKKGEKQDVLFFKEQWERNLRPAVTDQKDGQTWRPHSRGTSFQGREHLPKHWETLKKAQVSCCDWLMLEMTSAFFLWGPQAGQYQAREGCLETKENWELQTGQTLSGAQVSVWTEAGLGPMLGGTVCTEQRILDWQLSRETYW